MIQPNICSSTDFYKFVHWKQYPKEVDFITSYCEAREGAIFDEILFNGLIPILKDHFEGSVVTRQAIEEAAELSLKMGGEESYFNREMWEYILDECNGELPLVIKALDEGTVVRPGVPLFTIENVGGKITMPLVGHAETILMHIWNAITVGSSSRLIKKAITPYVLKSGSIDLLPFMVHSFGFRGVSSYQTSIYADLAHLINFQGTDNAEAVRAIQHYYPTTKEHVGYSVWATEHSVATSFGPGQGEIDYLKHQLENAPDNAIISIVMDSYDSYNFAKNVVGNAEILKLIKQRTGRTVFRPDSGDPQIVVPRLLDILSTVVGYSFNDKGYKVLNYNIGLLQGDGMDFDSIPALYNTIVKNQWSSDNLVVGSGGGLLQKWNRDDLRFAIKASYGEKAGKGFDIYKNPLTSGSGKENKTSKRGKLVVQEQGNLKHIVLSSYTTPNLHNFANSMKVVFKEGVVLENLSFNDIQKKSNE